MAQKCFMYLFKKPKTLRLRNENQSLDTGLDFLLPMQPDLET